MTDTEYSGRRPPPGASRPRSPPTCMPGRAVGPGRALCPGRRHDANAQPSTHYISGAPGGRAQFLQRACPPGPGNPGRRRSPPGGTPGGPVRPHCRRSCRRSRSCLCRTRCTGNAIALPITRAESRRTNFPLPGQRRQARRGPAGARRWLAAAAAAAVIALGGVAVGSYVADQNDPLNQVVRGRGTSAGDSSTWRRGNGNGPISSSEDALVVKMNGRARTAGRQGVPDVADPQGRLRTSVTGPDGCGSLSRSLPWSRVSPGRFPWHHRGAGGRLRYPHYPHRGSRTAGGLTAGG